MAVSGYLLPPDEARKSRRGQYLFLNGRPVEDQVVWRALAEAHRGSLVEGRHPGAWLWLEIDPLLVDVNVHPSKREVRFHRPAELRALVLEAVEDMLRREGAGSSGLPGKAGSGGAPVQDGTSGGDGEDRLEEGVETRARETGSQVPAIEPVGTGALLRDERSAPFEPQTWSAEVQEELPRVEEESGAPSFRVVGILEDRYLLLEASDGLVLLEGEAARERILYESFMEGAKNGTMDSQGLLVPLLLELEPRDADVVSRNAENFRESGMEVEPFGGVTIQLRSVPVLLKAADPRSLLLDLVDELLHSAEGGSGRVMAFEKFAGRLARVGARGERCRVESAHGLLDQLFACDQPYCTPGGSPTLVQLSSSELRRKFGK